MTIDPLLPIGLVVVLLTCLFAWSIILEWRRPLRFKALRLLACAVAVLALGAIFIRPAFPGEDAHQTLLLTASYSQTVADSLRRALPQAVFYSLDAEKYRSAEVLSSYRQLFPGAASTYGFPADNGKTGMTGRLTGIVGEGLPSYALDSLQGGFFYLPSPLPNGITTLTLPRDLQRNKVAVVKGIFHTSHLPAWLTLSAPSGKLDSVQLLSIAGSFAFEFTPKVSGRVTYALTLTDSTGTSVREPVPLVVEEFVPLNILILQEYPTFELSHLKNYLADRGHRVAVRARLSQSIYRTEFINRIARALNPITPALLVEFDLLIADPSVLTQMPAMERSAVTTATRNGLGTLMVFNGVPQKFPSPEMLPVTFVTQSTDTVSVALHGRRLTLPATRLSPSQFRGFPVSTDRSRILSGYASVREGTTGFQLLRETYSLLLAGDSVSYGSLWSPLIDATARTRTATSAIHLTRAFPLRTDEPVNIEIVSRTTPSLYSDSMPVPVMEDPLIDGLWRATVWPGKSGWHALTNQTDTLSYFVFSHDEWQTLRIAQQQDATRVASTRPANPDALRTVSQPLSLIVFWIAFLLATGFLWLAPKI